MQWSRTKGGLFNRGACNTGDDGLKQRAFFLISLISLKSEQVFLSEIAIPINRHVINVGVSFGYSCDCGSIQFPLASFERPTCIATETTLYTPGHVSLSTAADSRSHDLKSWRCEIVSLENLTRVSGCQEGSMLSSSIAAVMHVKVRSDQIKYIPHAFENLYDKILSDIETRPVRY